MPQDSGVIVAWKNGMVSSTLGTTTYEVNAREKSINMGLDQATKLLGKLHEAEYDSPPCVERAFEHKRFRTRPSLQRCWNRIHQATPDHAHGAFTRNQPGTIQPAVTATNVSTLPALARHQMATWGALTETHLPSMPALARQRTARWEAVTATQPVHNAWRNVTN